MSTSELLVVGVVLAVAAAVAAYLASRLAPIERTHEAVVDGPPGEWLDDLALATGGLPGHQVSAAGPSSLSVTRRYVPAWAVFLAVLLFPVGLLALAIRRERTATVVARRQADGRTAVSLQGWFDPRFIGRVNALL